MVKIDGGDAFLVPLFGDGGTKRHSLRTEWLEGCHCALRGHTFYFHEEQYWTLSPQDAILAANESHDQTDTGKRDFCASEGIAFIREKLGI